MVVLVQLAATKCLAAEEIVVPGALVTLLEEVLVPAREEGVLGELPIQPGDAVRSGELLGRIVDDRLELAEQRAEYELKIAEKDAQNRLPVLLAEKSREVARAELERAQKSDQEFRGSVSQSELDKLALALDQASLQLQQAQHELEMAELSVDLKRNALQIAQAEINRRILTAPFDGIVVDVNRRVGEWVTPGDAVVRVLRYDRLRVEGFVPINAYRQVRRDTAARFQVADEKGNTTSFPGRVTFVSPEFDPVNKQTRVWAEIDNSDGRLQPGTRGTLLLLVGELSGLQQTSERPRAAVK